MKPPFQFTKSVLAKLRLHARANIGPAVRRTMDSQDAVQQVVTESLERPPKKGLSLRGLRLAVLNRIRDVGRRRSVVDFDPNQQILPNQKTPSSLVGDSEEFRNEMERLNALGSQARDVIKLTVLEGRSDQEAAEILGITEGHVRVIRSRALNKLKRPDDNDDTP